MKKSFYLVLILFFLPNIGVCKTFIANGPLVARTQNPIYLQTLGQQPTGSTVLAKNNFSNWLNLDYSNIFEWGRANGGNDEVLLDMELARIGVNVGWGIGYDMQLELEIPFLHFNGGYLDQFIQDFHKAFHFPNAGRENFPNGAFAYRIIKDGQMIYNVKRQAIGLSDIVIGLKHNFIKETKTMPGMSWRYRLKLPTGRPASGTGSGNIDYSLGFILEKSISRWHFYLNLDYIVVTGNKYFDTLYHHEMLAWMAAIEFSVSQPISIIAELQGSTQLLSGMDTGKWDGVPVDLILGVKGTHKKLIFGNDFFWQWSFSEDVASEGPSVDITTMLVLGIRFGQS